MNIPSEVIERGTLTVYLDTPSGLETAVREHNKQMSECRRKMKRLRELELAFAVMNLLVTAVIAAACAETVFRVPLLSIALLAAFAAVYVIFAIAKGNYIIPTIAALPLLILDWRFAFVLAADAIVTAIREFMLRPLKAERGYPLFPDVRIIYEKVNAPKE